MYEVKAHKASASEGDLYNKHRSVKDSQACLPRQRNDLFR